MSYRCCTVLPDPRRLSHKGNKLFIETVLEEESSVDALYYHEKKATIENPRVREQLDTTNICKNLHAVKKKEYVENAFSKLLRENSHELRDLSTKLQTAEVCAQLDEQLRDLEKYKNRKLRQKLEDDREFAQERKEYHKFLREQEIEENKKKIELRNALLKQISEREVVKKQKYEEVLKERELMKISMERLEQERRAEENALKIYRENCREEMLRNTCEKRDEKIAELLRKILEAGMYSGTMKEREEIVKAKIEKKQAELRRRQEISKNMGLQLLKVNNEKKQREDLLLDLLFEERTAKEERRYQKVLEKQFLTRMQMRCELSNLGANTNTRQKQMDMIDDKIYNQYLQETNDAFYKEQLELEAKQRQLDREHQLDIIEMIRLKNEERKAEAIDELRGYKLNLKTEREFEENVANERIRMIKAQRPENLRFLKSGILRKSEEKLLNMNY